MLRKQETTGHDLLADYDVRLREFQEFLDQTAAAAADRASIVEARLQELEAEKLVLNQLAQPPKALVARQ